MHFLSILSNFFQILALFLNITWKLPNKTLVKIFQDKPEIILKKLPFWGYDDILTPKIALFDPFEQFFADLGLFLEYNMEGTP